MKYNTELYFKTWRAYSLFAIISQTTGNQISVSIGLLGTKIGMTQVFSSTGSCIPVTVLRVGPCIITQIKTTHSDGYNAIQIGYSQISSHLMSKARLGHLNKTNAP